MVQQLHFDAACGSRRCEVAGVPGFWIKVRDLPVRRHAVDPDRAVLDTDAERLRTGGMALRRQAGNRDGRQCHGLVAITGGDRAGLPRQPAIEIDLALRDDGLCHGVRCRAHSDQSGDGTLEYLLVHETSFH
ncbi:hypothetical protein D3C85_1508650 [compost metagenome]